jgi:hypothetical protein
MFQSYPFLYNKGRKFKFLCLRWWKPTWMIIYASKESWSNSKMQTLNYAFILLEFKRTKLICHSNKCVLKRCHLYDIIRQHSTLIGKYVPFELLKLDAPWPNEGVVRFTIASLPSWPSLCLRSLPFIIPIVPCTFRCSSQVPSGTCSKESLILKILEG